MAVVLFPGVRVAVAESLIRDLGRVSEWCDLWGMKLNASKTKTMVCSPSHPPYLLVELYWRSLMTMLYCEWHLIPKWLLRNIFALFPEQLLNDLVCWGSPGECSMIDHFVGDAFDVLSCQFWSTVLQSGARLPIHTLNYRQRWAWITLKCNWLHYPLHVENCILITLLITEKKM